MPMPKGIALKIREFERLVEEVKAVVPCLAVIALAFKGKTIRTSSEHSGDWSLIQMIFRAVRGKI